MLVLEGLDKSPQETWYRVRLPILPNNSTGWVPGSALGELVQGEHAPLRRPREADAATLKRNGVTVFTTQRRRRQALLAHAAVASSTSATSSRTSTTRSTGRSRSARAPAPPYAHRLARRRLRRRPRHEPAAAPPGPRLARLHPDDERGDPAAGEADAGRHAAHDPLSGRRGLQARRDEAARASPRSGRPCSPRPGRRSCPPSGCQLAAARVRQRDVREAGRCRRCRRRCRRSSSRRPPAGTTCRGCPAGGSAG